ncbi:hypothetical protein PVAG01_06615 [Phlyctema vagabunda]|uniref:Uncharacterized protein n=1 Tax=Phlyctema vagabunda TaxID=108571 RepID=A0ABR4PGP0_9HELO
MDQTTARLRKTFRYPTENDSDDSLPEALDEEEQESLIQTLHEQNRARNTQYTYALLAISVLSTLPYTLTLFHARTALLSLLSITSLLSTSYILYSFAPARTGILILDDLNRPPLNQKQHHQHRSGARDPGGMGAGAGGGPIEEYLPFMNLALCTLLVLAATVLRGKDMLWNGFGVLPGVVYAVVLVAKVVMAGVDPEAELGELKYGFKGA